MYRTIFNTIKKIIPNISDTELIALRTGNVHIDRDIFQGNYTIPNKISSNNDKNKFNHSRIDHLLSTYGNSSVYPNDNTRHIFNVLGKNKFFSFLIPEQYGGIKLSTQELSSILTKIASKNVSLGVSVMVPNSLGPSELLINYGTKEQKSKYLPKLANGDYIPCFGLTGPDNGSDALGKIDKGIVKKKNGKIVVEATLNKRYITLAPVANLIGLALKVEDPDNLLDLGKPDITVFLVEKDHLNLKLETHHNPLDIGFPNGTIKGNIDLELSQIIGGEEQMGNGWKMLMECLAAGRGICLPATANASAKTSTYGIFNYIKHRKQFNIPLIKMEGVSNKFADMVYNTWLIQTSIAMTNTILDSGNKPSVISAIMKQQTTERAREVVNHAVDIHGGSAICLGENNFTHQFYKSIPVGITVEGSNTLTKNLIIFGQGLNKSHPHIYNIYDSIVNDNISDFKVHFNKMVKDSLKLYIKSIRPFTNDNLRQQTIDFANLSNFVALLGGEIKKNQSLSADMADILSNIYLCYSLVWYEDNYNVSDSLKDYCLKRLLYENSILFNRVIDNYPNSSIKIALNHMKRKQISVNYNENRLLIEELLENPSIMDHIKENIYIDNAFSNLEKLDSLDRDSQEYSELYQTIISVGETPNYNEDLNK